jgi:hypothetical protein
MTWINCFYTIHEKRISKLEIIKSCDTAINYDSKTNKRTKN